MADRVITVPQATQIAQATKRQLTELNGRLVDVALDGLLDIASSINWEAKKRLNASGEIVSHDTSYVSNYIDMTGISSIKLYNKGGHVYRMAQYTASKEYIAGTYKDIPSYSNASVNLNADAKYILVSIGDWSTAYTIDVLKETIALIAVTVALKAYEMVEPFADNAKEFFDETDEETTKSVSLTATNQDVFTLVRPFASGNKITFSVNTSDESEITLVAYERVNNGYTVIGNDLSLNKEYTLTIPLDNGTHFLLKTKSVPASFNGDITIKYAIPSIADMTWEASKEIERSARGVKKVNVLRTIGAIVYDGWSQDSLGYVSTGNDDNTRCQDMYEASSVYNSNYPDWRDYTEHALGVYPCYQTSFANLFPSVVAGMTDGSKTYPLLPSRKPITALNGVPIGWRSITNVNMPHAHITDPAVAQSQCDEQIKLASEYGIDYFAICIQFYDSYFTGNAINEEKLMENEPFVYQFLNSPFKGQMKFCVYILNTPTTAPRIKSMYQYIYSKFVTDDSYFFIDGKPVVLIYHIQSTVDKLCETKYHIRDLQIVVGKRQGFQYGANGVCAYGGYVPGHESTDIYTEYPYTSLSNYNEENVERNFTEDKNILVLPASFGRGESARSSFRIMYDFSSPTKQQLVDMLEGMIDYAESLYIGDKTILIYAWNEFTEGGYIMPTQYEIDNGDGYYRLEAIQEAKAYWKGKVY